MASTVTIPGSSGSSQPITLHFNSPSNFALAEQIAAKISASVLAGHMVIESDANGAPPTLPDTLSGAYVQASAGIVSLPKNYTTDVVTKPGSAIVYGSGAADQMILSGSNTSLTYVAKSGSGTVVAGGGDNRITAGGHGDWSLNSGGGNDIISALSSGAVTVAAGGGHNAILLGNGNDVVTSTGDDTIIGHSGSETVDASGAGADFVRGNSSHLLFAGGMGGATILGGTGSDTYFGAIGGVSGGQMIVGGTAGNNALFAGDGAATLKGGGNNDQLFGYGGKGQVLIAGTGNETLSAAFTSGNDTLQAGSGNSQLIGGLGNDTFVGGTGHATVTAGYGNQVLEFIKGHGGGSEMVQGIADPSSIMISLQGYQPNEAIDALAGQTMSNGSVSIALSDGTKVTFQGVTSLNQSNFS